MVITDIDVIPKEEKETEYISKEKELTIFNWGIGLQFKATVNFDEYCWIFGDKRQEKFDNAFQIALYEFLRNYIVDDDDDDNEEENEDEQT